jgi:hypothetical protein
MRAARGSRGERICTGAGPYRGRQLADAQRGVGQPLRQVLVQDGDVIGGGVRPRPTLGQQPGQRFVGVVEEAERRMVAERAFSTSVSPIPSPSDRPPSRRPDPAPDPAPAARPTSSPAGHRGRRPAAPTQSPAPLHASSAADRAQYCPSWTHIAKFRSQAGHLGHVGQQPGAGVADHTPPVNQRGSCSPRWCRW